MSLNPVRQGEGVLLIPPLNEKRRGIAHRETSTGRVLYVGKGLFKVGQGKPNEKNLFGYGELDTAKQIQTGFQGSLWHEIGKPPYLTDPPTHLTV